VPLNGRNTNRCTKVKKMEGWIMLAIASGVMFSIYNIILKTYSAKTPANISLMVMGACIFICGLFYLLAQKDPAGQASTALPVVGLIIASAAVWFIGAMLQVSAWADPKAAISIGVVLMTVSSIVATAIFGMILFGEKISTTQMVGMCLAIAGTLLLSS